MTLKERKQIIKDLQTIVDNYSGSWQRFNVLNSALTLIKELAEEIKDLEADYDRVYEQAEADIHGNMADGGTSCHWCMDKTKADTVKKMQTMIKEECIAGGIYPAFVARVVENVEREMLEGNDNV